MDRKKYLQSDLVHLLEKGSISLPAILFTEYKRVGLSENEVVLLIHLILFQEKEKNFFPTVSELEERMSITTEEIINLLQNLVRGGFLRIEEEVNKDGLHCERYCISPLIQQIGTSFVDRESKDSSSNKEMYRTLFHLFEQEFGRALSPLECEALSQWIDEDRYKEELIEAALREAVYCGKVNFRYIDRILLEWQRNQVKTKEEAANYSRKFRQKGILYQSSMKSETRMREKASNGFSFYNWINHK